MEHQSRPLTFKSLFTGLVTVPMDRQCEEQVFQEVAKRETNGY